MVFGLRLISHYRQCSLEAVHIVHTSNNYTCFRKSCDTARMIMLYLKYRFNIPSDIRWPEQKPDVWETRWLTRLESLPLNMET